MMNTVIFENNEMNRMLGYIIPHIKEETSSFVVFTKNARILSDSLSEYLRDKDYSVVYAKDITQLIFNISTKNAIFIEIKDKYTKEEVEIFNRHFDMLMRTFYDYAAGLKENYDVIINDLCIMPKLTHIIKYIRLSEYDLAAFDLNILVPNMDDFIDLYKDETIIYDFDYYIDMTNHIIVNLQIDDIQNTTFKIY